MGVNIESGEYQISTDELSWVLSHRSGKNGDKWKAKAWYSSLSGCLAGLMEKKIRAMSATTWEELAAGLREIKQELKAIEKHLNFQT